MGEILHAKMSIIDESKEKYNSLLYWYPKVQPLLPTPKTVWLKINDAVLYDSLYGEKPLPSKLVTDLKAKAREIGYPVFMKTANVSGKHEWKMTCYVESEEKLISNLMHLVEFNICLMPSPDMEAIIFREFLPMESLFTAFGGDMPINKERRYFINEGKVVCHHPYWPDDAMWNASDDNWPELLAELNNESVFEIALLTKYAERVANKVKGFWSVDFSKTKDNGWVLIDMAIGERSYHPEDCPHNRTPNIDLITGKVDKPWERLEVKEVPYLEQQKLLL